MYDMSEMGGMHEMHSMETMADKAGVAASNSFCEGEMGMVM